MLSLKYILVAGLGGMIGTILRFSITYWIGPQVFPYATFSINIAGSFVIGLLFGLLLHADTSNLTRIFLATGVCGGFTTFAAFSIECVEMFQQQKFLLAATYIAGSILLGIAAAFAGFYIGRQ